MRLEIEVLDGNLKGSRIRLSNGLSIGRNYQSFKFTDKLIAEFHGQIVLDHKNDWNFKCLDTNVARVGLEEVTRFKLIPGLVFHLGQTGFKVVEKNHSLISAWNDGLIDWIKQNPAERKESDIFFFLHPIRLTFAQGPQYEEFLTIGYGPRVLGFNCLDLNLIDPSAPKQVARFFQIGEQCYIENLCGNNALINSNFFDQHPIQNEDKLKIGSTIIELSILK